MKTFVSALCLTIAASAGAAPRIDAVKNQIEDLPQKTVEAPVQEGETAPQSPLATVRLGESVKKLTQKYQLSGDAPFTLGPAQIFGSKNVSHLAIDVQSAGGLQWGDQQIPADQTLENLAIPGCTKESGAVICDGLWFDSPSGRLIAHLQTSSLAILSGKWRSSEWLQIGDGRPRLDLRPGASASIAADSVKFGDSRCVPKQEKISRLTRSEWLSSLNLQTDAFAQTPVVYDVATGCTDILGHLYAVGDQLVVHRAGVLYVFSRR